MLLGKVRKIFSVLYTFYILLFRKATKESQRKYIKEKGIKQRVEKEGKYQESVKERTWKQTTQQTHSQEIEFRKERRKKKTQRERQRKPRRKLNCQLILDKKDKNKIRGNKN